MKKIFYSLLAVFVFLLGVCIFGAYTIVRTATVPDDNYGQNYDVAFTIVYNRYPEMKAWYDSLVDNNLCRDIYYTNEEGLTLHGLLLEHPDTDTVPVTGTMMIIHGYCDDAPVMMRYAYCDYEVLHQNVLLPERRWCGKSEGDHITFGWLDSKDMHHWLDIAHNLWQKPIVVHGLSMGAATTMMLSGDEIPDSLLVEGYVEDCGYSSTWDMLAYQLKSKFNLPAFPTLYIASGFNKIWHGWWFSDGDAVAQVAKCKKPMLFIHGQEDDFVPFEMVHKVYNAHPGPKYLWEVPNVQHARSIHRHFDEYCQRLQDFLNSLH